ncbi:MAG: hypothetical protein L6407_05570 [Candidatus Delongbacteria bacterium]|nr:hypothetical protein [Candidatus Delongbacteria bacterium]
MKNKVISRMILANVLEMNTNKYSKYVCKFIENTSKAPFYRITCIDDRIIYDVPKGITGIVQREKDGFKFYSSKYFKLDFELFDDPCDIKWKHSMNWIKTKNILTHNVMNSILELQRDFFETNDRKKMIPISLKEFIEKYQFPYLDISRLSRIINNTVISFNNAKYFLKDFFCNKRKIYSNIVEYVISQQSYRMKDNEIQEILIKKYNISLTVRTICNYRKSNNIPAYNKINLSDPYRKKFSRILSLHKKILHIIPDKAGVYEISVANHVKYPIFSSEVIYYGRSNNLRNRIQNYLCANIKNITIKHYQNSQGVFLRYFATLEYVYAEKELLERFISQLGSLPIANKLKM